MMNDFYLTPYPCLKCGNVAIIKASEFEFSIHCGKNCKKVIVNYFSTIKAERMIVENEAVEFWNRMNKYVD